MMTKEELKALLQNDLDTVKPEHYSVVFSFDDSEGSTLEYEGDDYEEMIDAVYDNMEHNEEQPDIAGNILVMFSRDIDDFREEYNSVEFNSENEYSGLRH